MSNTVCHFKHIILYTKEVLNRNCPALRVHTSQNLCMVDPGFLQKGMINMNQYDPRIKHIYHMTLLLFSG